MCLPFLTRIQYLVDILLNSVMLRFLLQFLSIAAVQTTPYTAQSKPMKCYSSLSPSKSTEIDCSISAQDCSVNNLEESPPPRIFYSSTGWPTDLYLADVQTELY